MRAFALVLFLAIAAGADPPSVPPRLTEVPAALGTIGWETGPAELVARADRTTAIVWLGVVAAAKIESGDDGVTHLRLLCRHLPLVDPGLRMLAEHVFAVRRSPTGYFVATLDVQASEADGSKVVASLLAHRHYTLVAGRYASVGRWGGHVGVVLDTTRLEVDDHLRVEFRDAPRQPS